MPVFELLTRSALYFMSGYFLSLLSWVIADRMLPRGTRPGLKLLTILLGQFMFTSIVVQTLGLAGMLRGDLYLAVTLTIGVVVSWWFRDRRPNHSLIVLCCRTVRLWVEMTPYWLGYFGAGMLLFLTYHVALVSGIDSQSIHGPMVVDWIQQGKIMLHSHWNYPQCWEYQYVPNFLLLQSDVLAVVPRMLQALALMLLIKELGVMLRTPGKVSQLTAWLCVLSPVLWGGSTGEYSLKNDVAFALGLLMSLAAILRLWRGRRGAIWQFVLGSFLVSGTKPTGFLYTGMLFLIVFLLESMPRRKVGRQRFKRLAALLVLLVLVQATPLAIQVANTINNGNPVYPIGVHLGDKLIFEGQLDLRGTSILDHVDEPGIWRQLLLAGSQRIGVELWVILAIFVVAALHALGHFFSPGIVRPVVGEGRAGPWRTSGRPGCRRAGAPQTLFLMVGVASFVLWFLFLGTPFSAGHKPPDTQFIKGGTTLRYAIAPLCLTYLISMSYLRHRLGRRYAPAALSLAFPLLVLLNWCLNLSRPVASVSWGTFLWYIPVSFLLLAGAWQGGRTVWRRISLTPLSKRILVTMVTACTLCLLTPVYAQLVEHRRLSAWTPLHRSIWKYVRNQMPENSTIGSNSSRPLWRYVLYGGRLNNRLIHTRLTPRGYPSGMKRYGIRYYYLFFRQPDTERVTLIHKRFLETGWREVARNWNGSGILLMRDHVGRHSKMGRTTEHPRP